MDTDPDQTASEEAVWLGLSCYPSDKHLIIVTQSWWPKICVPTLPKIFRNVT